MIHDHISILPCTPCNNSCESPCHIIHVRFTPLCGWCNVLLKVICLSMSTKFQPLQRVKFSIKSIVHNLIIGIKKKQAYVWTYPSLFNKIRLYFRATTTKSTIRLIKVWNFHKFGASYDVASYHQHLHRTPPNSGLQYFIKISLSLYVNNNSIK